MGQLSREQSAGLQQAVRAGTGLAGIHGGMGDAFRGNLEYEWMVGGHFVGHLLSGLALGYAASGNASLAARAKLLKIFEATGLEDEWVVAVRRRLSRLLFG
jgi:hypothetical protein